MKVASWAFALAVIAAPATAADDPICADRPGKSTPTCTVAPGHWQLETGLIDWSLQKDGGDRSTSTVIAETLIRVGLTDRSEIQFDVTPWQRERERVGGVRRQASGFGDLNILYLHRLTGEQAPVKLALMPAVKLPTANHSIGNGKLEAALLLPTEIDIGRSPFSLNLTPEVDWSADSDGRGHHAAMTQVASLGWQATQKLSIAAELWRQWDWDPAGTQRQASADATAAYLVNNDVQIDGGANIGLNRATPDIEVYAGLSKRF